MFLKELPDGVHCLQFARRLAHDEFGQQVVASGPDVALAFDGDEDSPLSNAMVSCPTPGTIVKPCGMAIDVIAWRGISPSLRAMNAGFESLRGASEDGLWVPAPAC